MTVLISGTASAQFSGVLSRMEKGKWKSAEEAILKILKKDSTSTEANFVYSWFFLESANPRYNIDSSYRYVQRALVDFSKSLPKEKERMKKFPIDSAVLLLQRRKIDSLAFVRAGKINTESGYADFIATHKTALERTAAAELRDEIAFLYALKNNSIGGYKAYITKYPSSIRAAEAQARYEKLIYQDRTRDGRLESFELFCADFPDNRWRSEAERNIFEITTASGRIASFTKFIGRYPNSPFKHRAIAIRYHLLKEDDHESVLMSDSLHAIHRGESGYWVPIFKNGKFGFMDQDGIETIQPSIDSISREYRCGNIRSDYLIVAGGVINRAGTWLVKGPINEVQDLGSGFLKITRDGCVEVMHKSGWAQNEKCFSDGKVIAHNFIAFATDHKWGLRSLAGRTLFEPQFDDVVALDTLIIFVKNGKSTIASLEQIAGMAEGNALGSKLVFDDVKRMPSHTYLVRNGALEGVINNKTEFVVPLDRFTITGSSVGFILEEDKKYRITGLPAVSERTQYDEVRFYGNWVKLRIAKQLRLYNIAKQKLDLVNPDSLWFEKNLAFARRRDSLKVFISATVAVNFPAENKITFIKSIDSSRFFFVSDKTKKTVFNAVTGKRLFVFMGDAIEYIGHKCFLTGKGNKKGLTSVEGKILLPIEYSAIVPVEGEWLSLLKEGKFGLYHMLSGKLVKAVYNRNVKPYSRKLLVAYKDKGYGFIGLDAKPLGEFEFDDIRIWNDTSALVKKNFQWMIYGVRSDKVLMSDIKDYRIINESPSETLAVIHRDNYYGVISSRKGEVIPASFSEIINIGSVEEPLFFSEKEVEEAGIHVVVYYDRTGKVLRKQALEEEEYEKLFCDEN